MMEALPEPLRQMRRFLVWKATPGPNGRTLKIPYYASGERRNGQLDTEPDLRKLVSLEEAYEAYLLGGYAGVGFALAGDGIGAFDLDHCLDDRRELIADHPGFEIAAKAKDDGAYLEVSPSGRGLRILGPCQIADTFTSAGVEYYGARRFVTITADVWANPGAWKDLDDLRTPLRARIKPVGDVDGEDEGIITPRVIDELRDALTVIAADEREIWIRLGHALKTLPGEQGRELWLDWSAKSEKFNEADAERVWNSLSPTSTSYKAVFAEAQRNGWKNPRKRDRARGSSAPFDRRYIDLGDKPELRPTEFVLDGFLPAGASVIAGAWGAGKSTNLIPLIASVAHLAPEAWGFRPALRRHVVWITEAPDQALDTLYSLARSEGAADWQEFREWFHLLPSERRDPTEVADDIKALAAEQTWTTATGFEVKPVVVLDTTTANIDLENESDNSQVGAAMSTLKQALRGTPLVLIGHTPKALVKADVGEMTFRGAGAWEAEAAATYYLVWDQETDMRFLAIRKARFTPAYREINFDHEGGSLIVDTPWGEPQAKSFLHGVPSKSDGEARKTARREVLEERREEARERTRTTKQQQILKFVRECVTRGPLPTKAAIHERLGGKKTLLFEAVNRLLEAGEVAAHPITKEQLEVLGLKAPPTLPEVILPSGVDFPLFFDGLKRGNL